MTRPARRTSFANVVAGLTSVNVVLLATGLITGPIIARVLGPEGRGELAAVMAVLTMAPAVLDLGLSNWIARERAIGRPRAEILGAALPVSLACSLVGVAAAIPVSHVLGQGRSDVTTFLQVGLVLMPVVVCLQTLLGLTIGESRWRLYAWTRIAGAVLPAAAMVALWLLGELTVASAAISYIAGPIVASLALLTMLRGVRGIRLDRQRSRAAATFGVKSWLNTVTAVTNNRADQILMAGLVPSRELGHYAVAVTISAVTFGVGAAVSSAIYPRVAGGDGLLAARACRITVLLVATVSVALAILTPWMVPLVFGDDFRAAVPMTLILLASSIPASATIVVTAALTAANQPSAPLRAELVTLALAMPALIVLLPPYGGNGAAVISLLTYTLRVTLQLRAAQRTFDCSGWSFVMVKREDLRWIMARFQRGAALP